MRSEPPLRANTDRMRLRRGKHVQQRASQKVDQPHDKDANSSQNPTLLKLSAEDKESKRCEVSDKEAGHNESLMQRDRGSPNCSEKKCGHNEAGREIEKTHVDNSKIDISKKSRKLRTFAGPKHEQQRACAKNTFRRSFEAPNKQTLYRQHCGIRQPATARAPSFLSLSINAPPVVSLFFLRDRRLSPPCPKFAKSEFRPSLKGSQRSTQLPVARRHVVRRVGVVGVFVGREAVGRVRHVETGRRDRFEEAGGLELVGARQVAHAFQPEVQQERFGGAVSH